MKAGGKLKAGYGNFGLFEIDKPTLRNDDDVLFRVTSVGMCGTDVSIYKWTETAAKAYHPVFPLVTGHEMSGIVEEVGKNVTRCKPGDHITVNEHIFCGECEDCKAGRTCICPDRVVLGCHVNGAMTQYVVVRQQNCFKLPDNIPPYAGSIAEPLSVSIHAVERMPVEPGELVVVFGVGTIGLGVILALLQSGAKVIAATRRDSLRLRLAAEFGAIPVAMEKEDVMDAIHREGRKFADKVFECVGVESIINKCFEVVRCGGSICEVGIPGGPVPISMGGEVAMNEKNLIGSRAFYHSTWDSTIKLLAERGDQALKMITHRLPLEDFASAIDLITSGECIKVVIEP